MGADLRLWGPGFHAILAFYPSWTWTSKTSCSIFIFLASLEAPSTIAIAKLPHGYSIHPVSSNQRPLSAWSAWLSLSNPSFLTAWGAGSLLPLGELPELAPEISLAYACSVLCSYITWHRGYQDMVPASLSILPHGGRRCSWRDHRALTTRLKREDFVYWHR